MGHSAIHSTPKLETGVCFTGSKGLTWELPF